MAGDDDQEYELGDVLAELVASVGADAAGDRDVDRLNSNKALSARLTAEEVALERAEVRAIPELVRALHELVGRKDGPAIAIVSDFYMSAENLRTIVAGVDERLGEIQIFSSVDVGRSKRAGGALFEHVRDHFGVTAELSPPDHSPGSWA